MTVEGIAAVEEQGGMALAERLAHRYYTPERAAQAIGRWRQEADRWVVIAIEPRRIRSMASG